MEKIRQLLNTILPTISVVAFAIENIDTNDTGLDDKIATETKKYVELVENILTSLPQDTKPIVVRGYAETKAFCENVLVSMDFLITSNVPFEAKQTGLRDLVKSLSDKTVVYQAKNGNDAKVLDITRKSANEKLNRFLGIPI